jgi:hypothetical protein
MRPRLRFLPLILAALGCGLVAGVAEAGEAPDGSMRIYRDPETGAVGPPSAAALRATRAAEPAAAAESGLQEEPVRAAAGGVKVNLRGRHRPAVVRHLDGDGTAVHECVDGGGSAGD